MRLNGADVYRRVDDGRIQIEANSTVAGWDDHAVYSQRVRNYTGKPIALQVRRTMDGHILFRSRLGAKNYDYRTVEYAATVQAGQSRDLWYEVVQRQERNVKQSNLTVEEAEAAP